MSIIKSFLDQASKGMWVTANKCNVGDTLKILTPPEIDSETFKGKSYLVMDVVLERTQESMRLRLSASAVKNIVGAFGEDPYGWVGKKVKVAGKTTYAGLGKEGLIYIPS